MRTHLSPDGLHAIHDTMVAAVERRDLPGVVVHLACGDDVHTDAVGTLALDGPPITERSLVRISSMTKPVVAVAALTLVEDGTLALDDAVDRWLPELAAPRVLDHPEGSLLATHPAARAITVRDLLTFRLGHGIVLAPPDASPIAGAFADPALGQGPPDPAAFVAPDEWIRRIGALPLQHDPGAAWRYGTGADVLGVLLARATGRPLADVLRERVLDPLAMVDTAFWVAERDLDRFATEYELDEASGSLVVHDAPRGAWSRPPAFCSGAAGLVSTAADYARFAAMLAGGGALDGVRILQPATVAEMTTDRTPPSDRDDPYVATFLGDRGWGLGLAVARTTTPGEGSAGSYGWDGGFGTTWRTDPVTGLTVIVLTQVAWTSPSSPLLAAEIGRLADAAVGLGPIRPS